MKVGPTATKQSVLEELLEQGMVLVALDARAAGVDVPAHLAQDPQLRLNLSYRFGLPMDVNTWGVSATLTFAGSPFDCRIPWTAIFLLVSHVSGQPYLFPDDIPAELLGQEDGDPTAEGMRPTKVQRPKLTLVTPSEDAAAADEDAPASAATDDAVPAPTPVPEPVPQEPIIVPAHARQHLPAEDEHGTEAPPPSETLVDESSPPVTQRPRSRGHLRLVK